MPGPPLRPMPRATRTWPGATVPSWMAAIAAGPSSNTMAGPVKLDCRPGARTPSLRIALSGASEPCRTTIAGLVGERAIERPDHLGVVDHGAGEVVRDGGAGHRERAGVEHRLELLEQRLGAAGVLELLDRVLAVGAHGAEDRDVVAQVVEEPVDVEVEAGLDRGRLQVLDAVDRAGHAEHGGGGVAKGAGGHDVARLEVLEHHLDDPRPRAPRGVDHLGAVGPHRRAAGQRHARAPRRRRASSSRWPSPGTRPARGSRCRPSHAAGRRRACRRRPGRRRRRRPRCRRSRRRAARTAGSRR